MSTFKDDFDLTVRAIQGSTKGSVGSDATFFVAFVFTTFKRLVDYSAAKSDVKQGQGVNPFDLTQS